MFLNSDEMNETVSQLKAEQEVDRRKHEKQLATVQERLLKLENAFKYGKASTQGQGCMIKAPFDQEPSCTITAARQAEIGPKIGPR